MFTRNTKKLLVIVFGTFLIHSSEAAHAAAPAGPTKMSPEAKPVEHDPKVFGADPSYDDKPYSSKNQIDIYGAKNQSRSSIHYWNCSGPYTKKAHLNMVIRL